MNGQDGESEQSIGNNGINVGTAEVVVEMNSKSDYQGSKTLTATITPAKISDLKFVIKDTNKQYYNGKQKKPVVGTDADIKLGKVSLNDMFDVAYGKNIDAGKEAGTVTLTPKAVAAKNFDGSSVTTTFDIERRNLVNGSAWAIKLTNDDGLILDKNALPALEWTGKEVEFANSSVILNNLSEVGGQGTNVKSNKDYTLTYQLLKKKKYPTDLTIYQKSLVKKALDTLLNKKYYKEY